MLEESEARQRILGAVESGPIIWVPLELALGQAFALSLGAAVDAPACRVAWGQTLARRGDPVTPARIGLLASQGVPEIPVFAKPLVQLLDGRPGLVPPGSPLCIGESYDCLGSMLHAAIHRAGGIAAPAPPREGPGSLRRQFDDAVSVADIVIFADAASRGPMESGDDLLELARRDPEIELERWDLRLEPEMALCFGRHASGSLVFGLPEDPVSALVAFALFVAPAICKRLGLDGEVECGSRLAGLAGEDLANLGDRPRYLPAIHRDGEFALSDPQDPWAPAGVAKANCLVRLEGRETMPRGASLSAIPI